MNQYRAEFDATVTFLNGGGLSAHGFRVDIPDADVSEAQVARLFIASLSLLMVERVDLTGLRVVEQAHQGTRGGPSDPAAAAVELSGRWRVVDLSHVITAGMVTYPGLPGPAVTPHLTREQSRVSYAEGTEFTIDRISMVGNTGTYLDTPFHRCPDGTDLAGLDLSRVVDLPVVVVRAAESSERGVGIGALAALDVAGAAVLLHTGGDVTWGTDRYAEDAPFLTADAARWLVDRGAALVGIDSVNIDDVVPGGTRPAHTALLVAGTRGARWPAGRGRPGRGSVGRRRPESDVSPRPYAGPRRGGGRAMPEIGCAAPHSGMPPPHWIGHDPLRSGRHDPRGRSARWHAVRSDGRNRYSSTPTRSLSALMVTPGRR